MRRKAYPSRTAQTVVVWVAVCGALLLSLVVSPLGAQNPDGGFAASSELAADLLATRIDARVVVGDRAQTAEAIVRWAESSGGYFTLRSFDRLELRVPDGVADSFRAILDEVALGVLAFNPEAQDLRRELSRIEAGITSRRESLERIFTFLETADVSATLAFEKELSALLAELESLVGRRRVAEHRVAHTYITVILSSRQQDIPTTIPSSFDWINELGLYRFLAEVRR